MHWTLKCILAVLALILLAMIFVLVPAHLQVRSVVPALPSNAALLALTNTPDGPSNISYILTSSQPLSRGQISHISILVEWENGQRFLIDTGMSKQGAEDFASLLSKMDPSAGQVTVHGTISDLLGAELKSVTGVGFTHLHIDHIQGLENFCAAKQQSTALMQTTSQQQLHNFNTTEGAEIIANSCLERLTLEQDVDSLLYTSKDFPGMAAFELGGHTPGSTLWAIALKDNVFLFSGDITNDKHSLIHDTEKAFLYSTVFVPENTQRTEELRNWLASLDQQAQFSVIVSHDLDNTQQHLNALKTSN